MHILVTNDDGIYSPGISPIASELTRIAHVSVLAPDRNWSASSHARTLDKPLRIKPSYLHEGFNAWMVDGSPADCVVAGINGFVKTPVDLVVSGINTSANMAQDVMYSGTVAAAMEAAMNGIPAIALSLDGSDSCADDVYQTAASIAIRVIMPFLDKLLTLSGTVININIPLLPEDRIKGIQVTRLGTRIYNEKLENRQDPRGRHYYWTVGDNPGGSVEEGTDINAVAKGFVSVTPLKPDLMAYNMMEKIETMVWDTTWNSNSLLFRAECVPGG